MIFAASVSVESIYHLAQVVYNLFNMTCWKGLTHLRIIDGLLLQDDGSICMHKKSHYFSVFKNVINLLYKTFKFSLVFEVEEKLLIKNNVYNKLSMFEVSRLINKMDEFISEHFPGIPVIYQFNFAHTSYVSQGFIKSLAASRHTFWVKVSKAYNYHELFLTASKVVLQTNHLFDSAQSDDFGVDIVLPVVNVAKPFTYKDLLDALIDLNTDFDEENILLDIDTQGLQLNTFEDKFVVNTAKISFNSFMLQNKMPATMSISMGDGLYKGEYNKYYSFDDFIDLSEKCDMIKYSKMGGLVIGDLGKDVYSNFIPGAVVSAGVLKSIFQHCLSEMIDFLPHADKSSTPNNAHMDETTMLEEIKDKSNNISEE